MPSVAAKRQCDRLGRILTYSYNWRDTGINATVVVLQVSTVVQAGSSSYHSLFWLPCVMLVCAMQLLACVLSGEEGFSMVWCALAGVMIYEQLRHHAYSDGTALVGCAVASAVATSAAMAYYAVEEVHNACRVKRQCLSAYGSRSLCAKCWFWSGSTALHLVTVGLGAGLVAAADAGGERSGAFWAVLGAASALALGGLVACRVRPPSARVAPGDPALSSHAMRLDLLRAQLERTQRRLAEVRDEAEKEERQRPRTALPEQPGHDSHGSPPAEATVASPAPVRPVRIDPDAPSLAARGLGAPDAVEAVDAPRATARETAEVLAELRLLEAREAELWERIASAADAACESGLGARGTGHEQAAACGRGATSACGEIELEARAPTSSTS